MHKNTPREWQRQERGRSVIEAFNAGEKWMEIEKSHTERPVLLDFFKRPFKKLISASAT